MQSASAALLGYAPEVGGAPTSVGRRVPGALWACNYDALCVMPNWDVKPLRPRNTQAALSFVASADHDVRCAIVRPEFHRGEGVRLVAQLRELRPLLPVLLSVETANRDLRSLAYLQGIDLAVGRDPARRVRAFVESSLVRPRTTLERLESRVAQLSRRYALTPRERRIAAAAVRGVSRAELLASFEISVNTLKSQTRSMLRKTGHSSLNELCRVVLAELVVDAS